MAAGPRIALVNTSNARPETARPRFERLLDFLAQQGIAVVVSPYVFEPLFSDDAPPSSHPAHPAPDHVRASILTDFFADPEVSAIFDISGGEIANGVLAHLDFGVIRANPKPFAGYSDLTTLVNALFVETGRLTYLWQLMSLGSERATDARQRFIQSLASGAFTSPSTAPTAATAPTAPAAPTTAPSGPGSLFELDDLRVLQGDGMAGILVGGNLSSFLKLAGTRWFPELDGRILALESLGRTAPEVHSHLIHLGHLGAFERCAGLLIGQFTELARTSGPDAIEEILADAVSPPVPIARTERFGHSLDSRALAIGAHYEFTR